MKTAILVIYFILQFNLHLIGQIKYHNSNGDFAQLMGDTLLVRLSNKDAFATRAIGMFIFELKDSKLVIKELLDMTDYSSLFSTENSDSLVQFTVRYDSNTAIPFASIVISEVANKREIFSGHTDTSGNLYLPDIVVGEVWGREVFINVKFVGYEARKVISITPNTQYVFTQKVVYPFIFIDNVKRIKDVMMTNDELTFKYGKVQTVLKKEP